VTSWIWFRITYPFGTSHCCSDVLSSSLVGYATNHGGWFPYGRSTLEASLSLLCDADTNLLDIVRGKNIPLKMARESWSRQRSLDPESCGWHYVEGLQTNDDPQIALAWDKVFGLGHNGQRIRGLAHEVILVDGSRKGIAMKEWPKFAQEQREKLAKVIASRPTNSPPIRWSDEETLGTNWFPVPKTN